LQYVLGYEWFCGHRFNVAPGVLIPRPETEELVREVVSSANGPDCEGNVRVLDICTGSGCIAWSVAAELGKRAQVYGCDISPEALAIACGQEIDADVKFFECDILAPQAEEVIGAECGAAKFDIIVSNPPYVCECEKELMQKNVLDFEPELALFVPDDDPLRFYRRIAQLSGRLLKPGGKLFFEINERFGRETVEMLEETGFVGCRVLQDIFGKERMVVACR
jgi:release factor glutamine methyltransferase